MKSVKKSIAVLLLFVLIFSLSGCKGDNSGEQTTAAPVASGEKEDMSADEIMAVYCKVYDTSKASNKVFGVNSMNIPRIVFDGKQNTTLEGIISKLLDSLFKKQTNKPLPPSEDDNSLDTCLLTGEDVEEATYTDNGDGTATIHFVPKGVHFPECEKDPQGKTFNLFADLKKSIGEVKQITWAQGTIDDNMDVYYHDGYVDCTFDIETNMITSAKYVANCDLKLDHANFIGVLKDKSVEITMQYVEDF